MGFLVWGSNSLLLREKLQVLSSLLIIDCSYQGWVLWWDCVSISASHFDVDFFLICPICRSQSPSFYIFSRGNFFLCSYWFNVSTGGGEFRITLCYHLELEPYMLIKLHQKVIFNDLKLFNNSSIKSPNLEYFLLWYSLLGNAYCQIAKSTYRLKAPGPCF